MIHQCLRDLSVVAQIDLPEELVLFDAVAEDLEALEAFAALHVEFLVLTLLTYKFLQSIVFLQF